jgi:hypothetical protein
MKVGNRLISLFAIICALSACFLDQDAWLSAAGLLFHTGCFLARPITVAARSKT